MASYQFILWAGSVEFHIFGLNEFSASVIVVRDSSQGEQVESKAFLIDACPLLDMVDSLLIISL
jgi:hypothetical protein